MLVRFSKSDIQPNPIEVDYWVDISKNPYGNSIKYYNGRDWKELGYADELPDLSNYYTKTQVNQLLDNKQDVGSILFVNWNDVQDKPSFAQVATSGDYNDLINLPQTDNKVTTTTSISQIDVTSKLVIATISTDETYSLDGILTTGKELHTIIKNDSETDIIVTIPTDSPYVCIGESEITVSAGGYSEINAISDGTNIYLRGA